MTNNGLVHAWWRGLLCRLGVHDWAFGSIVVGKFVVESCRRCPAKRTVRL